MHNVKLITYFGGLFSLCSAIAVTTTCQPFKTKLKYEPKLPSHTSTYTKPK